MVKIIVTIVIGIVLYFGFNGSEKYDIDPFIMEWVENTDMGELKDKVVEVASGIIRDFSEMVKEMIG